VDKAKDKALYALNDLCDKLDGLDDMRERWEVLLDPKSKNIEKRLSSVKERLIEVGTTIVEPLTDYLYIPDSYSSIIAADVLGEIGSPTAVPALIDRINDRLDKPGIGEYGHKISTAYAIDALSMIPDQRSFHFMVELLDRFEGDNEYMGDLEHLCRGFPISTTLRSYRV